MLGTIAKLPAYTRVPIVVLVLSIIGAGCANGENRPAAEGPDAATGLPDVFPADFFEHPLGPDGVEVSSPAEANLPFVPLEPTRLGSPERIVVLVPEEAIGGSMVAWTFDDPDLGRFAILEYPDDTTEASLKDEVAGTPERGCRSSTTPGPNGEVAELTSCTDYTASFIRISETHSAMVIDGDQAASATWVQILEGSKGGATLDAAHLLVQVIGPSTAFSPEQAIEVASLMAKD